MKQKYWKTDEEEEFQTEMMEVGQRDGEKEGDEGIEDMKEEMEKPGDFLESNKAIFNLKNHEKKEKVFPTRKEFPEILKTKKATTKIMKFSMG